jgi:putative phosphoribosyl transferase
MSSDRIFPDRAAAGAALGRELKRRQFKAPLIVLGLPRGGVPVADEVAQLLKAPLDVMLVRKIGMPGQRELAMGAIASGNVLVHEPHLEKLIPAETFDRVVKEQRRELERRERLFRGGRPPLELTGKTVILVDDGLATGSTMLAAVRAARQAHAAEIVVTAPVASREAADLVRAEADRVVILETPAALFAIGQWYQDFEQIEDDQVIRLLARANLRDLATEEERTSGTR